MTYRGLLKKSSQTWGRPGIAILQESEGQRASSSSVDLSPGFWRGCQDEIAGLLAAAEGFSHEDTSNWDDRGAFAGVTI